MYKQYMIVHFYDQALPVYFCDKIVIIIIIIIIPYRIFVVEIFGRFVI